MIQSNRILTTAGAITTKNVPVGGFKAVKGVLKPLPKGLRRGEELFKYIKSNKNNLTPGMRINREKPWYNREEEISKMTCIYKFSDL